MHSSRLKKKIEQAESGQYGNLQESFVTVGTALPSLATTKKDANEFKPIWEQEVYDEQGRRRLHGAFTGGFSAGYFNTVGSKEGESAGTQYALTIRYTDIQSYAAGWTPSTFKSSRSSRAQASGKTIEDAARAFMDEEDLAELESSRKLETSDAYSSKPSRPDYDPLSGFSGQPPGESSSLEGAFDIGAAAFATLIEPASTRVGLKLMRKMGWRDGQGVGPRLTHEQRQKQAQELGVKLAQDEDHGDQASDTETSKHYFAPIDRPLTIVGAVSAAADRGWGLGYTPGLDLNESLGRTQGVRTKSGLGVGLNDEDDVYDAQVMPGDKRAARVIEVFDEDEDFRPSRPADTRARESHLESFPDGTAVLSGFKLQQREAISTHQALLPPQPPKGWKPDPTKVWAEAGTSASVKGKGKQLDADERGSMLGEQLPPTAQKSVFEYLSAKDKQRLASLQTASSQKDEATVTARDEPERDEELSIPALDGPTALAALKGFEPFGPTSTAPDPVKQARYTLFLKHCANLLPPSDSTLPFGPRPNASGKMQTMSEFNRELNDYAKAARVFKPMSTMLAGRFTSGGASSLPPTVTPGLYQPEAKSNGKDSKYLVADSVEPVLVEKLTPAQQAVRAGLFGDATRSVSFWQPQKLLCKRFGIRPPHSDSTADEVEAGVGGQWKEATATGWGTGAPSVHQVLDQTAMDDLVRGSKPSLTEREAGHAAPSGGTSATIEKKPPPAARQTIETVGLGDDESQGQETLTYERAPKDIFAAIFADSDEEDDESDDEPGDASMKENGHDGGPVAMDERHVDASAAVPPGDTVSTPTLSADTIAEFKPSFVARSVQVASTGPRDDAGKSKKKKKASKPPRSTLSFAMDDEADEGGDGGETVVKHKKRKRDRSGQTDVDRKNKESKTSATFVASSSTKTAYDDDEWAEAAPSVHPDIVAQQERPVEMRARAKAADLF
ncbi:hypothetical protein OIV83_006102 [Microbotryomycetes sp. JL201]|nr:hypothetical protein OIV83_006102 [Microbotryomycetes sp. JL201]